MGWRTCKIPLLVLHPRPALCDWRVLSAERRSLLVRSSQREVRLTTAGETNQLLQQLRRLLFLPNVCRLSAVSAIVSRCSQAFRKGGEQGAETSNHVASTWHRGSFHRPGRILFFLHYKCRLGSASIPVSRCSLGSIRDGAGPKCGDQRTRWKRCSRHEWRRSAGPEGRSPGQPGCHSNAPSAATSGASSSDAK